MGCATNHQPQALERLQLYQWLVSLDSDRSGAYDEGELLELLQHADEGGGGAALATPANARLLFEQLAELHSRHLVEHAQERLEGGVVGGRVSPVRESIRVAGGGGEGEGEGEGEAKAEEGGQMEQAAEGCGGGGGGGGASVSGAALTAVPSSSLMDFLQGVHLEEEGAYGGVGSRQPSLDSDAPTVGTEEGVWLPAATAAIVHAMRVAIKDLANKQLAQLRAEKPPVRV